MANLSKILPACGFAVGVALVLATSAFKEQPRSKNGDPMYTFQYNPPGGTDYSATSVESIANWSYTPDSTSCSNVNTKACKIYASQVDNTGSTPALLPSEDITAHSTATGSAFVYSTFDGQLGSQGASNISNKQN